MWSKAASVSCMQLLSQQLSMSGFLKVLKFLFKVFLGCSSSSVSTFLFLDFLMGTILFAFISKWMLSLSLDNFESESVKHEPWILCFIIVNKWITSSLTFSQGVNLWSLKANFGDSFWKLSYNLSMYCCLRNFKSFRASWCIFRLFLFNL